MEFFDIYHSHKYYEEVEKDNIYDRLAWQNSLLMTATGNFGKKGIEAKKLYEKRFDNNGDLIEEKSQNGVFTPIDRDIKNRKMDELLKKFNKK